MLPAGTPLLFAISSSVALIALLLSGCATTSPAPTKTPSVAPLPGPPAHEPAQPAPRPTPPTEPPAPQSEPAPAPDVDPAAAPVVARLAKQLRIDEREITVAQVARAEWPNGCLGLAAEGEICSQMLVPGYAVSLIANEQRYEFRTDESARRIRLAFAPLPETGEALVTWRDSASFSVLLVGTERVAFGLRGQPRAMLMAPLPGRERERELVHFVSRFAPFYARTAAGETTFRGVGSTPATPLDQRRIAEWARLVSTECENGLPARRDDRAFVWRRTGGIAGVCDEVVVSRSGWAMALSCRTPDAAPSATVELSADELEQLYRWLDTLAPVSWENEDAAVADAMTVDLEIDGHGTRGLSEPELERMLEFSNALVRRLLVDGVEPAP